MKYISIDLETTGLDSLNHQIIEFGAVLEDTNNILPLDELPTFHAYITHPDNMLYGDIFAIHMNAGIIEKIKNKKELKDKYNFVKIEHLAEDFMFWLRNVGFELKTKNAGTEYSYIYAETINVAGKNFSSFDSKFLDNVPDFNKLIKIRKRVIDPSILFTDWNLDNALPELNECNIRIGHVMPVQHTAVEDATDVIRLLRTQYIKQC